MVSILDLSNNYLSGTINTTFNAENRLSIINLYGNKLKGKVPPSLINCRYLEFLDLGDNELNDTFPSLLGGLPGLKILSFRSNKLHGPISDSRTNNSFAQIRVIDLSSNGFSGNLPVSLFENFQAMKIIGEKSRTREYVADYYPSNYANTLIVTTKGLDLELPRVLTTEVIINLSRNRFEGYLPSIIGDLVGLRTLNLSHNCLEGIIPALFHQLSENSLIRLRTEQNDGLRGLPFSKDYGGDDGVPQPTTPVELDDEEEGDLISWQAVLMGFGCGLVIGLIVISQNDGLRGLPLSKDCGGDDGVLQPTTPVELDDDEEEEGDLISWQAVLMGFSCGLVIGMSIIYIMLSTHYPVWFSRMVVKFEHKIDSIMKRY
ncbi:receptor-like protein Cf-9 homolog [Capsicum annuum]|uniref:receptor-like protein Cf-9 homolog n=1 Tax=Capsicum annuum TaxID=4072 RepID=UPI001FB09DC9|nr:receptor-like protein Cf-9 homolog [Capsicum annuum]